MSILFAGQSRAEFGMVNRLFVGEEKLLSNTRAVQARNDIDVAESKASLENWEIFWEYLSELSELCSPLPTSIMLMLS